MLSGDLDLVPNAPNAGNLIGARYKGVRAEFVARDRNLGQVDTELVLQNTSAVSSVPLRDIVVLGRHGIATTLKIYKGLNGLSVPPLGQVVLPIGRNLGLKAAGHGVSSPNYVASVCVIYDGRSWEHLRVTAVVKQWEPSNSTDGHLAMRVEDSYSVTLN